MPAKKESDTLSGVDFLLSLGEELKRQVVAPNINSYQPHDKQIEFHSSTARVRLYAGGNRSGKSTGNVAECVYWLRKQHPFRSLPLGDYEPCRGRINAVDFINGVDKILLPLFKQFIPPSLLIGGSWDRSYHRASHVLTLSNKSSLEFLSYESDLDKFAGTSRHFVAYDEEPPEAIYTENSARLIDTGGSQWYSLTPLEGMSWLYDTLYLPAREGKEGYKVVETSMDQNPYLNQKEVKTFLDGLDDEERQIRGEGKFIQVGGLIYRRFDPRPGGIHVLDRGQFKFPKNIPIGISLDHGYNNPTAVLWHALLPEGKILTFHEHYLSGETVAYHARAIHQFNRQNGYNPSIIIADPSIRNTDPITGTSILQEYQRLGLPFQLANNDVKAGIERVNGYLKPQNISGEPMWRVTRDCTNLIREMGRYKWKRYTSKKLNAQYNLWEEPHKLHDHACDALRYFLMSRPNLDSMYFDANFRSDYTEVYDGVINNEGSDFTVRKMLRNEWEEYNKNQEYVHVGQDDYIGGIF